MSAAWLTPLLALAEHTPPDLICCGSCDAMTSAPAVGLPEGWDGLFSNTAGWIFTCPTCLDAIEDDWRAVRPSPLGAGVPQ